MARLKRKQASTPGFEGRRVIVPCLVDDVYQKGKFEPVVINVGESPLAIMYDRHQIDLAQYEAGKWFRRTWEQMRYGSMAVDPSHEPVDISRNGGDPIPNRVIDAGRELAAARAEIGRSGYRVVELVCGQGFEIREIVGQATDRERRHIGWLFRLSLDTLAEWRGYISKKA